MSKSEPKAVIEGFDRRKEYSVKITAVRGTERSKALLGRYSGQSLMLLSSGFYCILSAPSLNPLCRNRSSQKLWDTDISCSFIPDIPLTVFPSGSESGSEVSDVGVPLNQQDSVVSVRGDEIAEGEEKQSRASSGD